MTFVVFSHFEIASEWVLCLGRWQTNPFKKEAGARWQLTRSETLIALWQRCQTSTRSEKYLNIYLGFATNCGIF